MRHPAIINTAIEVEHAATTAAGIVGVETEDIPVHNPGCDCNDDLLPIGASYLAAIAERELG